MAKPISIAAPPTLARATTIGRLPDFTAMIERHPTDARAFTNRGEAYRRKGELMLAIADLSRAIELDPKDPMPFYDRGIAYSDQGEADRVIADYSEAIRLNPDDALYYNNRGSPHRARMTTSARSPTTTRRSNSTRNWARLLQSRHRLSRARRPGQGVADFAAATEAQSSACQFVLRPRARAAQKGRRRRSRERYRRSQSDQGRYRRRVCPIRGRVIAHGEASQAGTHRSGRGARRRSARASSRSAGAPPIVGRVS